MKPPPIAKPLTAAITGFSSAPVMNGSSWAGRLPPGVPCWSVSFMSSPAQKPRPVPVKIATSSCLSWRNSVQMRANSVRISVLSAFSRSGRFMRTTSTCPWRSVSTTAMFLSRLFKGRVSECAATRRAAARRSGGRLR